jgi:hypothetical protein
VGKYSELEELYDADPSCIIIDSEDLDFDLAELNKSLNFNDLSNLSDISNLTVRDLKNSIARNMKIRDSKFCSSHHAFNKIREAVLEVRKIDRQGIKPSSKLDWIFPSRTRINDWRQLRKLLSKNLPGLQFNIFQKALMSTGSLFVTYWMLQSRMFLIPLVAFILGVIVLSLFRDKLPADSVRSLVSRALVERYHYFTDGQVLLSEVYAQVDSLLQPYANGKIVSDDTKLKISVYHQYSSNEFLN